MERLRQQFDRERERHREEVEKGAALVAALQEELKVLKEKCESPSERESDSGLSATVGSAGVLAKAGNNKEKHVTFKEPSEPGKGQELAPLVIVSESGDGGGGGSGQTSTESQVGSEAPPSGESESTTSDSGGAGVVQGGNSSDNSLMQSLAQLVKTQIW